jgi:protein-disulfide isomerase
METQGQTPQAPKASNARWIALAVGGGCALVACIIVVVALLLPCVIPVGRCQIPLIPSPAQATNVPAPGQAGNTPAPGASGVVMPPARDHPQANGNAMGDPNAPVKVIEYADFQCPYCRRYWQETEPQIIADYVVTGKVYYEYHSVGAFIGAESADAAEAAYCAADQNKFWEYHDMLFANWTGENAGDFTPDKLQAYAAALQLDTGKFNTCLSTKAHADRVDQDVAEAKIGGVHGTPAFLINGKLLVGAQPYGVFQQAIDAALNGQ